MQLIQFCYKRGTVFIQASILHRQCHGIRHQRKLCCKCSSLAGLCSSGTCVLAELLRASALTWYISWKRPVGAVLLASLKSLGNKLQLGHELLLSEPPATGHLLKRCIFSEADPLSKIRRLAVLLIRQKKQIYYNSFTRSSLTNKRTNKYMSQAGD